VYNINNIVMSNVIIMKFCQPILVVLLIQCEINIISMSNVSNTICNVMCNVY